MEKTIRSSFSRHRKVLKTSFRKIENSKQFITNEAKRTNDTLLAFQHKFDHQLSKAKDELNQNIDNLAKSTDNRFETKSQ